MFVYVFFGFRLSMGVLCQVSTIVFCFFSLLEGPFREYVLFLLGLPGFLFCKSKCFLCFCYCSCLFFAVSVDLLCVFGVFIRTLFVQP